MLSPVIVYELIRAVAGARDPGYPTEKGDGWDDRAEMSVDREAVMRWRQVVSLMVILMSATLFTVSCDNGLRPDPNSFDFIKSRRDS